MTNRFVCMQFLSIHLFADGKDRTVVDEEAYHPVEVDRLFHLNGIRGVAKTKTTRTSKTKSLSINDIDDDSQPSVCGLDLVGGGL